MAREKAAIIDNAFPEISWTGSSEIHRSLAMDFYLVFDQELDKETAVSTILRGKFASTMCEVLHEQFPGSEFLMTDSEFEKLVNLEYYRHLVGQGHTESDRMLRNPNTGNVFHRLFIKGTDVVGGIRFWAHVGHGKMNLGFRVRVETLLTEEDEVNYRAAAAQNMEVIVQEWESVIELQVDPDPAKDAEAMKLMEQVVWK